MYFDKNIQAMPEEMNKLKEHLIKKNSEENSTEIEFGVEEIDGRKVLFAVKEGKLYQLDTMYNQVDYLRERRKMEVKALISKVPTKISVISVFFFIPLILLIILLLFHQKLVKGFL